MSPAKNAETTGGLSMLLTTVSTFGTSVSQKAVTGSDPTPLLLSPPLTFQAHDHVIVGISSLSSDSLEATLRITSRKTSPNSSRSTPYNSIQTGRGVISAPTADTALVTNSKCKMDATYIMLKLGIRLTGGRSLLTVWVSLWVGVELIYLIYK